MADPTYSTPPVSYSYYGAQDYKATHPDAKMEIQDPVTGQWYPYVPGDAHDNGRGNIRIYQPDAPTGGAGGGGEPFDAAAFQQIVGRPPTPEETAFYSKDPNWRANVTTAAGGGAGAGGGATDPNAGGGAPPPPPGTPAPPTGGGTPGGGGGGLISDYPGGAFKPPDWSAFKPAAYVAPTYQEAMNDPGYQFAQEEGQKGVERSAAARGVLNSGGTLQDIAKWNQALASTQYQSVADRAKSAYDENYKTQYSDPYQNAYQSAWDAWSAGYGQWKDKINISKDLTTL